MRKSTKISLIVSSVLLLLCTAIVVFVGKNVKPRKAVYCIDELVNSLEESEIVVEMFETNVTANEILSEDKYILTYRPQNGVKEFPQNITPNEVKIDTYGTFLLYYSDEEHYLKDYEYLDNSDKTAFVGEIRDDDIYVDNEIAGGDIISAYGATSYAPALMNSEEFALQVADSNRKLTVVVMDTGLYSTNSAVTSYFNLKDSYDFYFNDTNVLDKTDSHATCVTSTMLEVMGSDIMSKLNLINAKVLHNGIGSTYDLYTAIMHYADMGADIINCSLGSRTNNQMVEFAVDYASSKGVIIICASGNEYSSVGYPAAYESAIAVGAVDSNKVVADFSNKGKEVLFCAPGVNMIEHGPENTMRCVSGTSFSAPAITAFSVMVMMDDESIDTRDELVNKIKEYCVDLGEPGKDNEYGYGLPVYHKPEPEPETPPIEETTPEVPSTTEPVPEIPPVEEEPEPVPEKPPVEEKPEPVPETPPVEEKPEPVPETPPVEEEPEPVPETPPVEEKPEPVPETPPVDEKPEPVPETPPVEERPEPVPQKITVSFDANGGKTNTTSKEYEQGAKYGTLPTATRDYYKFDGWYTASTGGTKITSTTQLIKNSAHTLYAHWSAKTESGWTKYSDIPAGAKVTDTKYKYTLTSYTTSNKSSLSGWTMYDKKTAWSNYGTWSEWSTNKATATDSRKVETKQEPYTYNTGRKLFNYSHYKYWNTTYNDWYYTYSYEAAAMHGINIVYEEIGWSTTELFLYTKFGNSEQSWGTRVNGTPWFNEMVKDETATGYTTYYRYADRSKVTTYYYKKTENKETTSDPSGQKNVSNVIKYVKYIEK